MPRVYVKQSVPDRFWKYVKKTDGCWLWTGTQATNRYGRFWLRDNVYVQAHRFSFEMAYGPIANPDILVCHKCDVRNCVRPDHLFAGTQSDNIMDAVRKGRHRYKVRIGSAHQHAKLTEGDVLDIRSSYKSGIAPVMMAKLFGVTKESIYQIVKGQTWKHLPI